MNKDFSLSNGDTSENPAIWETEPKDNVDLDIYYEAGQAYPTTVTEKNIELFAPVGSVVSFPEDSRPFNGVTSAGISSPQIITGPVQVGNWSEVTGSTSLELVLSEGVNQYWDNNGYGESMNYNGIKIRFTRSDGGYTTATVSNVNQVTGAGFVRSLIVEFDSTETGLSWYNCFSFGNGIESNRIRDDFNAMTLSNGVKASTTLDSKYKEEHRKNGLIYSGLYNSTNGVNNLNQFIMAEKITKDLNPTYGSIQKLFSRRISLIAFCEDRVVGITANKNALYNADGNPQIVASNAVLGDANPFVGDYGISKNPESFARQSYRAYFTDKQRGAVLRLSMDGLTPISDAGMHDYFRDNLRLSDQLIGTYDEHKEDYNLTLNNYLPTNLITNSEIDEGSNLGSYITNPEELITNGDLNNGTPWVAPVPWAQVSTINGNPTIDTTTEIILHEEVLPIPTTATVAIDEIPASSDAFALNYVTSPRDIFYPGTNHNSNPFYGPGTGYAQRQWYLADGTLMANVSNSATSNQDDKWSWEAGSQETYARFVPIGAGSVIIPHGSMPVLNNEVITFKASVSAPTNHQDLNQCGVDSEAAYISYRLELVYDDGNGNDIRVEDNFLDDSPGHEPKGYVDLIDYTALNANGTFNDWPGGGGGNNTTGRQNISLQKKWKFKSVDQIEASQDGKISDGEGGRRDLPITPGDAGYSAPKGLSAKDASNFKKSYTVLYDDNGTQIGPSGATAPYTAVPLTQPQLGSGNEENRRAVYYNLKFKLTAWFTDGSGASTGPFQHNSDSNAQNVENNPVFPGNAGNGKVAFYINYVAGWKDKWYLGHGYDTGNSNASSVTTSTPIQAVFAGQVGQTGSFI